ncbi:MAG TPA: carboxypeptidase-like regulatory domain-containing protein [Candidatus Eremiobacteraceae bacterium]
MRHAFILAALCAAVTSLAGCNTGNGGPVGQGNYGTVFGTVTDSVTGKPIAGASIVISMVINPHTDSNGMYRVTGVPLDSPGLDESVVASDAGYQTQTKSVHVAAAGQQYEVDFQLVAIH